jgi:hypothetical protein
VKKRHPRGSSGWDRNYSPVLTRQRQGWFEGRTRLRSDPGKRRRAGARRTVLRAGKKCICETWYRSSRNVAVETCSWSHWVASRSNSIGVAKAARQNRITPRYCQPRESPADNRILQKIDEWAGYGRRRAQPNVHG